MGVKLKKAEKRFNQLLLQSFLETVSFGEVVLHLLELTSKAKADKLMENISLLEEHLESIYGDSAKTIEEKTVQNLYAKLGLKYRKTTLTFSNQVKKAFEKYIMHSQKASLKPKGSTS